MPTVVIDGISTRYEVQGDGPPLLMFSPGGFNARLENWREHGIYRHTDMLRQLQEKFTCIVFDKRESGSSGGRVERITWQSYARQGLGLLDHLGIRRAHLMGGCVGCSIALSVADSAPDRVASMVLYQPAGGARYRMKQHERFGEHLAYVGEHGLAAVVRLVEETTAGFSSDARVGPWAPVVRSDPAFAQEYAKLDVDRYRALVTGMARTMFDRDTVPGVEPEDLLVLDVPALIVPGQDSSHTASAARFLQELLPQTEYWDLPVAEQTQENAPERVVNFLQGHHATTVPAYS